MTMDAGKLRHRVALQSVTYAQNATTGEMTPTWATVRSVWAAIEPLSAREFIQSAANQSQIQARITVRYASDILASWRILHGTKIYVIEGVLADKDSGLEYLTLPCSLGVGTGE